ncbi:hypothetical protein M3Y99_00397200 [Aphelenchoides fujianensis]|nr:hypothetical protein M3Y99_00397200 [Aphelenchoides fujianensis]
MPQRLKDFLVFGKSLADPFHRIHYCDRPVLLFVEFCQAEGPKPICHFPASPGIDLDDVSVWLMSAENLHGSRLLLYSQSMDLFALVYHVTMLDLTARGFQRPLALAFLSSERPSISQRVTFKRLAHDLFRPLLACNRQLFCSYAERVVELANEIQRQKFHTYYSLQTESSTNVISAKIKQIAKQAGVFIKNKNAPADDAQRSGTPHFNLQFMDIYRMIASNPSFCECGKDPKEFEKFFKIMEKPTSSELAPLFELAPCVAQSFHKEFAEFYEEMIKEDIKCGVLFSAGMPVFKSSSGANMQPTFELDDSKEMSGSVDTSQISRQFPNENSLSCFGSALTQCVYPLLAGEKMAVLASDTRECTGADLLEKLNSIRVCRRHEATKCKYDTQLVGISIPREESQKWERPPNLSVFIDLNNHRLFSQHYEGRLLYSLHSARYFPSDSTLMLHLLVVISDICMIARVGRRVPLELIGKQLRLNDQDLLILANLLTEYDLVKFMDVRTEVASAMKKPYRKQRF